MINAHYYHPAFGDWYPIMALLPAVAPYVADDDLAIKEGTMASLQFHRMGFGGGDSAEKATIRTALLTHCERDTLAMVELRDTLQAKARN